MQTQNRTSFVRNAICTLVLLSAVFVALFGLGSPSPAQAQAGPTPVPAVLPTTSPGELPQLSPETGCDTCEIVNLDRAYVGITQPKGVLEFNTQNNSISRSGLGWFVIPNVSAITPDGKLVFMAGWGPNSNSVYGLSTESYTVTTSVPVHGNDQRGLAISKDGTRMYVADNDYMYVTVIDLTTKLQIAVIPLSAHPEEIALSPDDSRLYVSANTPGAFIVIDTTTNAVIQNIPRSGNLGGVVASPDGTKVFVGDRPGKQILVFNATDFSLITSLPITSSSVNHLRLNHNGSKLYALSYAANDISIFNATTLTFIKSVNVGTIQSDAAFLKDGTHMYIVGNNLLHILDTTTDTLSPTNIPLSGTARSVAAMPAKVISDTLLQNGGFNGYPTNQSMIPRYWLATGFAPTDGKFTAFKKEGSASVKIQGAPSATKILYQTFSWNGTAGDDIIFAYWARGNSIPMTGGFCRGQIFLYNATGALVTAQTVDCSTGNYATFEKKAIEFMVPAAYSKIVVKFTYSKPTGAIIFDMTSLIIK